MADSLARETLRQSPDDIDALEILFLCQQARNDRPNAEATLRRVIMLAPGRQWPRSDLARLLLAGGRRPEAEHVLRAALAVDESHAEAHAMLGALLSEREILVPGAHHLHRAIALAGRHPQLLANLGRNLMRQGKLGEAEPLLQDAIAAAPDMLAPLVHLAELAEQRDEFDRAASLLDRAETIARREGRDVTAQRAHLLSRTRQWRAGLALLDAVADLSGTPLLLRARLRDRAARYDEAWCDAVQAKAQLAQARGHVYAAEAVARDFETLAALAARLSELTPAPTRNDVAQPIFILGFPRSGTTMTEQVLASHSRIRAGGELPFVAELPTLIQGWTGLPFPAALEQLKDDAGIVTRIRDFYLAQAEAYGLLAEGADFFTDKMPLNEVYLPLLRLACPAAPLIAVQRDPRDILVSAMQHDMTHGLHCTYRLEDAARHLASVSDLTERYLSAGIAPYAFRYESFIADQKVETARLMGFIGLPPEPAQTAFHQSRRHAPTPSYAQVREPLHNRAVGRWRNYTGQLAPVAPLLDRPIARGGY
ncbi:tetratricopeptide repeat-containing sulfotransferase family protein [Sphingomonas crusticola]|uniref:tetratricopeptide repeat-containing sulfotransferase family protein n=1 Tax=Sphingomonas crusticola TaxID=1697973 RepID=UPI001F082B7D